MQPQFQLSDKDKLRRASTEPTERATALPMPPAGGYDKLRLLDVPAGRVWYRISPRRFPSALHFSTGPDARWNDPSAFFGVLYVADDPRTAFAETFGHNLAETYDPAAPKFVTEQELTERHLYRISTTRHLRLADFRGAGLATLNLDGRLLTALDYAVPQAWSRWVHDASVAPDGICYLSRTLPGQDNTALFDRCRGVLREQSLGALADWRSDRETLDIFDILDEQGWGLL